MTDLGRAMIMLMRALMDLPLNSCLAISRGITWAIPYLHLGGKRMGSIAFWVYMEIVYSIGVIFIFGVMAIGIYWGNWKEMVLITIALWSLATIVIARESNL